MFGARTIQAMSLGGHTFVKGPNDTWVSRAPFENIAWQSNAGLLQETHRRYGAVVSAEAGGKLRHSLYYFSSVATLQQTFGGDYIKDDFGRNENRRGRREVVFKYDHSVAVFEFFVLENVGMDCLAHPMTGVTRSHAQGMLLAIGADLMDDATYLAVVKKSGGDHATPNGKLFGPNGEEWVHSSIRTAQKGTADVNDPKRPDGPYGTRDYTGNVEKMMKETIEDRKSGRIGFRGGSWYYTFPKNFTASFRHINSHPGFYGDGIGFVARHVQDSK